MKTRNGFVSNSSSSSFIIFGEKVNWYDFENTDGEIWMMGTYYGEGYDVFRLTPEMQDLIVKKGRDGSYYRAYKTFFPEEETPIKREELPPVFTVFEFDRSQHSVDSLPEFKRRYIDTDENT